MEYETLRQQTNGPHNDDKMFDFSSSQNQVIENIIDDNLRRSVENAVLTVENCMHDTMLIGMKKNSNSKSWDGRERSITGLTGHGHNSEVQNPDRRNFLGNADNNPLMSASSRLTLNTNQNRIDETRNGEDFEGSEFSALRPSYDRRILTHHRHLNGWSLKETG